MFTSLPGVRGLLAVAILLTALPPLAAQVIRPARPESYDVQLRYRIRTDRDERIRQYRAMEDYLKKIGFKQNVRPNEDLDIFDPDAELLSGTIPSANALQLLREPSIRTVILTPTGTPPIADYKKPVQVRLTLGTGLPATEQQMLHGQVVRHLAALNFVEAIAYDHASYTTVRGVLPAENVNKLLKDLRALPTGWILPAVPREQLPSPMRGVLAIRLVEVLPDLPESRPLILPMNSGKIVSDVLAVLSDPARQEQPLMVEVILDEDADLSAREARGRLRAQGAGATLEGFAGTIATLRLPKAKFVEKLAEGEDIRGVRLPRAAREVAGPAAATPPPPDPLVVVKKANLDALHALGYRGDGIRTVVIASAFDGLEVVKEDRPRFPGMVAVRGKGLPKAWLLDFTGETSPTVMPSPPVPDRPGYGTPTAVALAAAAPGTTILLVRVDPESLHQVFDIAKAVVGTAGYSAALQSRLEDVVVTSDQLAARRRLVVDEYRKAFSNLSDDEIPAKRRADAAAAMTKLQAEEAVFKHQVDRFATLKAGLESLRGAGVVVNTLVWESGYPHDGLGALSRLIDTSYSTFAAKSAIKPDRNPPPPVWIQAGSTALGQVWTSTFRDVDNNGVMEFSAVQMPLLVNRWTRELNFMTYVSADGKAVPTIPAGTRIRVSMQWREPHNRDVFLPQEPAYPMRLRVLQQLDPEGKTYASDELVEVARSVGPMLRLLKTPGSGVYEVTTEFTAPVDGVYALRVEGSTAQRNVLESIRQGVEFQPRIVLEMIDGAQAAKGQVRFEGYFTPNGGVAIPGDATQAVTVGTGTPEKPTSMTGAGPGLALRIKPEVYATGTIKLDGKVYSGTAIAAGYAGGTAASLASAGVRKSDLVRSVGMRPGEVLRLPTEWLQQLRPRKPE